MRELLFKLLRSALWGKALDSQLSAKEFRSVMSLAENQTVFGLAMEALKDVKIDDMKDRMPLYEAIGVMEQVKQQNRIANAELAEFSAICDKNGLEYLVVKGQTVACLYPKPEWRQAGDIDFLVPGPKFFLRKATKVERKVQDYADALGVEMPTLIEKEVGFDRNGQRYELHTSLRTWAKKRHQKVWDALIEKEWEQEHHVEIEGVKVRTLTPTMNAAYIFIHLFFHFIREGVSLRQFCDWAMVLHRYREDIDRERLTTMLTELDLLEAYRAFGTILVDHLGLSAEEFPLELTDKDRRWKVRILEDIFEGGNFGKLRHRSQGAWRWKLETMGIALRNSFRYYRLCPSEVGGMIPRLVMGNMRILLKR